MRRRGLLAVGLTAGALLTVAGGTLLWQRPARLDGRLLAPASRDALSAVALTVLAGSLPTDATARAAAIEAHVLRLEATVAGLPPALQADVDELLALMCNAVGRRVLIGLGADWRTATPGEVAAALQGLRVSTLNLRQQVYRALRDLTNAAYFADPGTWPAIGYPGPLAIQ